MAFSGGLFSAKTLVATARIEIGADKTGQVETWTAAEQRQEAAYLTILQFLMYYARMMFFLSFRETANQLFEMMEEAVGTIVAAGEGDVPDLAHGWKLVDEKADAPRVYSVTLTRVGRSEYKCRDERPEEPDDMDVQGAVLLYLEYLVTTLPVLERAYLALSLKGMAEYYENVRHWHSSKTLHSAPGWGVDYARRVLEHPGSNR